MSGIFLPWNLLFIVWRMKENGLPSLIHPKRRLFTPWTTFNGFESL